MIGCLPSVNEVLGPIHLKSEVEGSGVEGHPQLHSKSDASLGHITLPRKHEKNKRSIYLSTQHTK